MITLRTIEEKDYEQIMKLHQMYYSNEFSMPDFVINFKGAFIAEDERGIVTVCGLRTIAEVIAITDKSRSPRVIVESLIRELGALTYVAERNRFDGIHAFVQDGEWKKHLIRCGFHPTRGTALVLEI